MASVKSMKALALEGFDRPSSVTEVPAPQPEPGEVLVRVGAASVNAYDTFVALGMMKDFMGYEFPAVIGQDLAGTVEAVGPDVDGFQVGDRVFGTMGMKGEIHDGSFAELATSQASALAATPEGLDDRQAGSLGVAGTTALSAVDAIDPGPGTTVLVVGATGGVGTFAIQLAALRGAHVIATVKRGDESFVEGLGAAETVDYSSDLAGAIRSRYPEGVDALVDLVNRDPDAFGMLVGLVRGGGRAVSAVGGAGEATAIGGVTVANIGGDPARLAPLAATISEGRLHVAVRKTYPLADAAEALTDFTNGHTPGKLVITMSGD